MKSLSAFRSRLGVLARPRRERRLRELAREARILRDQIAASHEQAHAAFAGWITLSPDHVQIWLEVTAFDEELARALGWPELGAIMTPVHSAETTTARIARDEKNPGRRGQRATRMAAAAALAIIAIALIAYRIISPAPAQYRADVGEVRHLTLPDGTIVDLDTDSRMLVRFTHETRTVEMRDGKAFFDIALDSRPFSVRVAGMTIEDIGTRFMIRTGTGRVSILVAEGKVRVHRAGSSARYVPGGPRTVDLSAGQLAEIPQTTAAIAAIRELDRAAVERRLAWTRGMLVFEEETLRNAVAEVNRYSARERIVVDAAIANVMLGGTFRATDPVSFARAVENLGFCEVREGTMADGSRVLRLTPRRPAAAGVQERGSPGHFQ